MNSNRFSPYLWIFLFIIGAGIRMFDLWHPVDRESWREADIASIARNFDREGMNILYPQIDWRGDSPGYAEMEFPVYPWLIASIYKIIGQYDVVGRILSFAFSLLILLLIFKLAVLLIPSPGSYIAALFAVFSPLLIQISTSIQPESLMLLLDLIAVFTFFKWIQNDKWKYFFVSSIALSLAILVKINNLYLGIFFLLILIDKEKFKFLKDLRIYFFGIIALLPPILWYIHAKTFWLDYGISLGLSNEYHWIGLDFFKYPYFITGIILNDLYYVIMPSGLLVMFVAFRKSEWKLSVFLRYPFYWFVAIYVYYILTSRTTADSWAVYYHCISVPPAAILFGLGINQLLKKVNQIKHYYFIVFMIILSLVAIAGTKLGVYHQVSSITLEAVVIISSLLILSLLLYSQYKAVNKSASIWNRIQENKAVLITFFFVFITFFYQAYRIAYLVKDAKPSAYYSCVIRLKDKLPLESKILVSGGDCLDFTGKNVAYNASYFFYWLDRKGFNICVEEQSIKKIEKLKQSGIDYFVAEQQYLDMKESFADDLSAKYTLLIRCDGVLLYKLNDSEN